MVFSAVVSFGSVPSLVIAMILVIGAAATVGLRKAKIPTTARWVALAGLLFLAAAAGEPRWQSPMEKTVDVLVDLSPSTRGARYRDSAWLTRRIDDLLGNTPFRVSAFADGQAVPLQTGWPEIPAAQTRFPKIDADAILLFSDGRFDLPAWEPPTYIVADINLENVTDAAVEKLEIHDQTLTAAISSSDRQRRAIFDGIRGESIAPITLGYSEIDRPLSDAISTVTVQIDPGDLWPENDSMSIRNSSLFASERWWISRQAPPGDSSGWRVLSPVELPEDSGRYLAPSVIVLNNVAASEIAPPLSDQLMRYVRDLGGSLLIFGGDHAFAAGHYTGTDLETLSPLSSTPPQAATRWILLVDASGSMAGATAGVTRWQAATEAAVKLMSLLPPQDPLWIGQFSNWLRWWCAGASVEQAAKLKLPPADAVPFGPTDLESALDQIAGQGDSSLPTQLLVLSDCDTRIEQPDQLSKILINKKIQLNVLALGSGSGLGVIKQMAAETGGKVVEEKDAGRWTESLIKLGQASMANQLMQTPITVHFISEAKTIAGGLVSQWNKVWLKKDAIGCAESTDSTQDDPLAATWRVGRGTVTAVAFSPTEEQVTQLARQFSLPPRDPRFLTRWTVGRNINLTLDAMDHERYWNDLHFTLDLSSDKGVQRQTIAQTAPGRYAATFPAPLQPAVATVLRENQIVDRIAIPGRYAPEFDALGNDHEAMQKFAGQTGGAIIWPANSSRIDFHWPLRNTSLSPWFSGIGAALMAAALLRCRAD